MRDYEGVHVCVSNPRVSKTAREKQVPNIIDYMLYDNNKGKRSKRKRIWGCKGKRTDRCGVVSNKLQFCKFGGKTNIKISLALSIAFSKQLHRSLHQKWIMQQRVNRGIIGSKNHLCSIRNNIAKITCRYNDAMNNHHNFCILNWIS